MKKLLLLFILLIVPTIEVHGYYCDYQDVARYKKIASNINYSYEYEEIGGNVVFHVTLVNLDSSLYLVDSKGNNYNYTSNELVVDASSGENLIFYVYPTDEFCTDKYIYSIRIQLPTYNKYYNDPICVGIENYTLCNKWSTHNLSYEKFTQNIIEYKKSLEEKPIAVEEEEKGIIDYIIEFLINYYYIVLIVALVPTIVIVRIRSKQDNIYN